MNCSACGQGADIIVEDEDGILRPYCFEHGCAMYESDIDCQDCPYFAEFCWDVNDQYIRKEME